MASQPGAAADTGSRIAAERAIVVASKPFTESLILGELFAQLLESRGLRVERRPAMGATEVVFEALRDGRIDVYPEYTGTGLIAVLAQPAWPAALEVFDTVSKEFANRWGLRWLPPLGFENTYAIATRSDVADRLGLTTLSDLARLSEDLRAGFTPDFIDRQDGLDGLKRVYSMRFKNVEPLFGSPKYEALIAGSVDVVDAYSTDGLLARHKLRTLVDDRALFPPYEAAALVGARLQRERPEAIAILTLLSNRIDSRRMRELNRRVDLERESATAAAATTLQQLGLVAPPSEPQGTFAAWAQLFGQLASWTLRHLWLVSLSLLAAVLAAVPAALVLSRLGGAGGRIARVLRPLQMVPALALLPLLLRPFEDATRAAVFVLFLTSFEPVLRHSLRGLLEAAPEAVAAARGCGMRTLQIDWSIRLPLAAPAMLGGVRAAAALNVGLAMLAALVGAGGLGEPVVDGLARGDFGRVAAGAIPAILLVLLLDTGLGALQRALRYGPSQHPR